jgi:hypothetical protein
MTGFHEDKKLTKVTKKLLYKASFVYLRELRGFVKGVSAILGRTV